MAEQLTHVPRVRGVYSSNPGPAKLTQRWK